MKFTIKKIILTIIPHGLIRFVRKKMNASYFLFGAAQKNIGTYHINDENSIFTLYDMEEKLGPMVTEGFTDCYKRYKARPHFLRKYLLEVHDCFIEPYYGWAITAHNNKPVFDSISNNTWIESYHPDYWKFRKEHGNALHIDEAVSINLIKGGEFNYWHFLHDLLGQVTIARNFFSKDIPFIISKDLAERNYFKQALAISPELAQLQWIIREEKMLYVKKAWFLQTMPNSNEQFFAVRDLLHVKDADKDSARKIFLVRSRKRIRFIKNSAEIEAIAKKYGFEIIDADGLSLQEQIKLFGETKWLIGIHGAGLTNVFYRKNAPMNVLELLPRDYIQPHYFWLSKGMGHEYDCVVGSIAALDTSFEVDPVLFEQKVKAFVQ